MLTLQRLQALKAVGEEGSFTRAAEKLLYSQSAVSQHIAALEDYLGVPLVNRAMKSGFDAIDFAKTDLVNFIGRYARYRCVALNLESVVILATILLFSAEFIGRLIRVSQVVGKISKCRNDGFVY